MPRPVHHRDVPAGSHSGSAGNPSGCACPAASAATAVRVGHEVGVDVEPAVGHVGSTQRLRIVPMPSIHVSSDLARLRGTAAAGG